MTATVSIVMPSYNEEAHISACLTSVTAQDYGHIVEILVADGRSSDRTREILADLAAADPRIRIIDNPARIQAAGLGFAVRQSTGGTPPRAPTRPSSGSHSSPTYARACSRTPC